MPTNQKTNILILCVGFALFLGGALGWNILAPSQHISPTIWILTTCAGLGCIFFSLGDQAKIIDTKLTLVGASAITAFLIFTWRGLDNDFRLAQDKERDYEEHKHLLNARVDVSLAKSANMGKVDVRLLFGENEIHGDYKRSEPTRNVFSFQLNPDQALKLKDEPCLSIRVKSTDVEKTIRFQPGKMIAAGYHSYFHLDYQIDTDKLFYRKEDIAAIPATRCDEVAAKESTDTTKAETNVTTIPPRSTVVENSEAAAISKPPAARSSQSNTSSGSKLPPEIKVVTADLATPRLRPQIIGYVVLADFQRESGKTRQVYFEIDGKPNSALPLANDTIVSTADKNKLWRSPLHWDVDKHAVGDTITPLPTGQKLKISGDVFITFDDTNRRHYAIAPVSQIIGRNDIKSFEQQPLTDYISKGAIGYFYGGVLSADEERQYTTQTYENITHPEAIFPTSSDILRITTDVWLRAGPRQWDESKNTYINAAVVKAIRTSQFIRVGGDIVLTKGGLAVWIPVAAVFDKFDQIAGK